MAKLLDDLMTRVGADWEPVEKAGKILLLFLLDCLGSMLQWLILLTMERLSTTRTDCLKILIEAGFEFLKDKVPMDLEETADLILQQWAMEEGMKNAGS